MPGAKRAKRNKRIGVTAPNPEARIHHRIQPRRVGGSALGRFLAYFFACLSVAYEPRECVTQALRAPATPDDVEDPPVPLAPDLPEGSNPWATFKKELPPDTHTHTRLLLRECPTCGSHVGPETHNRVLAVPLDPNHKAKFPHKVRKVKCACGGEATERLALTSAPDLLLLEIPRFKPGKIQQCEADIPEKLSLCHLHNAETLPSVDDMGGRFIANAPPVSATLNMEKYTLVAMVNLTGSTPSKAKYSVDVVMGDDNEWFWAHEDHLQSRSKEFSTRNKKAYGFMYARKDDAQPPAPQHVDPLSLAAVRSVQIAHDAPLSVPPLQAPVGKPLATNSKSGTTYVYDSLEDTAKSIEQVCSLKMNLSLSCLVTKKSHKKK